MKKIFQYVAASLIFISTSALSIPVTLDFEGISTDHYFFGGNTNLGGWYDGVTFGADATILDKTIYGYNDFSYPPKSGDAVLFSDTDPTIRADFDVTTDFVSLWFTTGSDLYLEAYNSSDVLIGSDSFLGSNIGSNDFLSVNVADISYVLIHDTGNFFTIDDFSFNSANVPEPSIIWLLGSGLALIGFVRRKA